MFHFCHLNHLRVYGQYNIRKLFFNLGNKDFPVQRNCMHAWYLIELCNRQYILYLENWEKTNLLILIGRYIPRQVLVVRVQGTYLTNNNNIISVLLLISALRIDSQHCKLHFSFEISRHRYRYRQVYLFYKKKYIGMQVIIKFLFIC